MSLSTPPMKMSDADRRSESRDTTPLKVTLYTAGATRELLTKDRSFSGISFIAAEPMALGQDCQVVLENGDQTFARFTARVVRSVSIDERTFEIAVQFRRQIAA